MTFRDFMKFINENTNEVTLNGTHNGTTVTALGNNKFNIDNGNHKTTLNMYSMMHSYEIYKDIPYTYEYNELADRKQLSKQLYESLLDEEVIKALAILGEVRICTNNEINSQHRNHKEPTWVTADASEEGGVVVTPDNALFMDLNLSPLSASPEDVILHTLKIEALRTAIDNLPEHERTLIIEYFFNRKTYKEIAEETKIPESTLKSRCKVSLKHLKTLLDNSSI